MLDIHTVGAGGGSLAWIDRAGALRVGPQSAGANPGPVAYGAGDTLTGIITGFLAQAFATLREDADALTATIAAVYVGGLAGDLAARARGMRSLIASDISEYLGPAISTLDPRGEQP